MTPPPENLVARTIIPEPEQAGAPNGAAPVRTLEDQWVDSARKTLQDKGTYSDVLIGSAEPVKATKLKIQREKIGFSYAEDGDRVLTEEGEKRSENLKTEQDLANEYLEKGYGTFVDKDGKPDEAKRQPYRDRIEVAVLRNPGLRNLYNQMSTEQKSAFLDDILSNKATEADIAKYLESNASREVPNLIEPAQTALEDATLELEDAQQWATDVETDLAGVEAAYEKYKIDQNGKGGIVWVRTMLTKSRQAVDTHSSTATQYADDIKRAEAARDRYIDANKQSTYEKEKGKVTQTTTGLSDDANREVERMNEEIKRMQQELEKARRELDTAKKQVTDFEGKVEEEESLRKQRETLKEQERKSGTALKKAEQKKRRAETALDNAKFNQAAAEQDIVDDAERIFAKGGQEWIKRQAKAAEQALTQAKNEAKKEASKVALENLQSWLSDRSNIGKRDIRRLLWRSGLNEKNVASAYKTLLDPTQGGEQLVRAALIRSGKYVKKDDNGQVIGTDKDAINELLKDKEVLRETVNPVVTAVLRNRFLTGKVTENEAKIIFEKYPGTIQGALAKNTEFTNLLGQIAEAQGLKGNNAAERAFQWMGRNRGKSLALLIAMALGVIAVSGGGGALLGAAGGLGSMMGGGGKEATAVGAAGFGAAAAIGGGGGSQHMQ